jgi:hypothetical protein
LKFVDIVVLQPVDQSYISQVLSTIDDDDDDDDDYFRPVGPPEGYKDVLS